MRALLLLAVQIAVLRANRKCWREREIGKFVVFRDVADQFLHAAGVFNSLSEEEMEARRARWLPPKPNYERGVLAKYAKLVSSASAGAVTS